MGKGGSRKKQTLRKRRKQEALADAILDDKVQSAAEERVLGTAVNENVADVSLFVMDRTGTSKDELKEEMRKQAVQQARERKRERRRTPKLLRSESALNNTSKVAPVVGNVPGVKKKTGVANVDLGLIAKRKFSRRKPATKKDSEMHDVWNSDLAEVVAKEKGLVRRRLEKKMNAAVRAAASVLKPSDGASVNPVFDAHQDKLGEIVAEAVSKKDDIRWEMQKISFDPKLLAQADNEKSGEVQQPEEDGEAEMNDQEESVPVPNPAPERKTRSERNKEKRRKASEFHRSAKIAKKKMSEDLDNLEKIAKEAIKEAKKLNAGKKRKTQSGLSLPKNPARPLLKEVAKEKMGTEQNAEPVALSEELGASMRQFKTPLANPVVRDRFLSYQRRGLVEPTSVLQKEKKQAAQEERRRLLKDKKRKNRRGSTSNISYWKKRK